MKTHRWLASLRVLFLFLFISTLVHARELRPHLAAGYHHTLGLKSDGTVVASGSDDYWRRGREGKRRGVALDYLLLRAGAVSSASSSRGHRRWRRGIDERISNTSVGPDE